MDLQEILLSGEFQWDGRRPATTEAIEELVAWAPAPLPPEYLDFLRISDGREASLSGFPSYLRLWPTRTVIESNRDYEIQRWLPGFVGVGDNGGPDILGFDTRGGLPYQVRAVPFAPMEWEAAIEVADDFDGLIRMTARKG